MTDCVIYTRVSSKEQQEGFSLEAQLDLLQKYAQDGGFRVVQEFTEVESAKAPGRPVFDKMLDYLKANPETVLLVEKTDRLVRNLKDYITLDDLKITVHFVKEGTAFGPGAKSNDRFMQGIKVLVATQYSENLSEEIMKGMTKRAEAGKWSCKAPYGYRSNPETRSLEIVPAEAEAIRWLFETYAMGDYSLRELCAEFRLKALPWRSARPIYPTLAHKMLNNPIYKGIIKWGDVTARGEHEPIVDPAVWELVQTAMHRRSRPKSAKHPFAYRGLIRCGHCGCLMTPSINKGHRYYKCSNARGKCTGNRYVREDRLTGVFADHLQRITLPETDRLLIVSAIRDFKRAEVDEKDKERERVSRDAARLQTMLDATYDDYLVGKIDREMWQRAHQRHSEKLTRARVRIQQLDSGDTGLYDRAERLIDRAVSASGEFSTGDPAKKRSILKAVVSNCTMTSGKLHHDYKKPFDIIAEGSVSSDWWG
jgi:site-specific DNA recombinase